MDNTVCPYIDFTGDHAIIEHDDYKYLVNIEDAKIVLNVSSDTSIYISDIGGEPPIFPARKLVDKSRILGQHPTLHKILQAAVRELQGRRPLYN